MIHYSFSHSVSQVQAVGWGRLSESGSLPTSLQQVSVKTIDYTASTCSITLNDRTLQFCAGVNGGGKGNG